MLSRVEDARVFESCEDVILHSSNRRFSHHQQLNGQTEGEEDEQLHPQHPYRMRKRVLQRESGSPTHYEVENSHVLMPFRKQEYNRPMEFVFLSSGEIRAREDCPPGLGLPKLQQEQGAKMNRQLGYDIEEYSGEESEEEEDRKYPSHSSTIMKVPRQQVRRQPVFRQKNEWFATSLSSTSSRSESSVSEDADVSSDDSNSVASKVSEESGKQLKEERVAFQAQSRRHATRNAGSRASAHERSVAKTARNNSRRTPTLSLKLDHLDTDNEDEMLDCCTDKRHPTQRSVAIREEKTPLSEATPHTARQRPAPLEQVSKETTLENTNDVPSRRTKQSPKMEVSHLVSDKPTPKPKGRATPIARRYEKTIERLETELQKEKKRVLEKMTQLLDEQGKNQQLRDQIEALEAQLAAKDSETSRKIHDAAREHEKQTQATEKEQADRINALEEQVRLLEAKIGRLKHDKDQLKAALKQLKKTGSNLSSDHRLDSKEATELRTELDNMTQRLHEVLAKVKRWKDKSKNEMQHCDDKVNLPALLERLWLDFPQFLGVSTRPEKETSSPTCEQQQQSTPSVDEQADAVQFLKKRLRQREDELRQTHVKYVELKELCARQCVREADLQNFINEHRLRGNLIIRKNSGSKPNEVVNNQDLVQNDDQDELRRSIKLKMMSSRGTNTSASYNDRDGDGEDSFVNNDYSDNQEDNDIGYDEIEDDAYPVRTPKVFVQVGRDGVYEHKTSTDSAVAQKLEADRSRGKRKVQSKQQRLERIRLVPSPSLAQRYERVPTPTTTSARRKKSAQQQSLPSSRHNPATLGECPPGCGSRPSFTRRKTSTTARAKTVKRPVSTATSKGAVGVIRPWM